MESHSKGINVCGASAGRGAMRSGQKSSRRGSISQHGTPPASTNAENNYLTKQKDAQTPVVVTLLDGERIEGVVEWYDAGCIKVRRSDGTGIVIMKSFIARFCKQAWSNNEYPARI